MTGNPAHLHALEWLASYADRYGADAKGGRKPFLNRSVAMMVESTSHLDPLPKNAPDLRWSVGIIPYPADGRKTTYSAGPGAALPQGARHPKEAAESIRFLAQKEVQMEWYRLTREPPARRDALEALIREGAVSDPREITMLELIPYGYSPPPLFSTVVAKEFLGNLNLMRHKAITPKLVLEDTQRTAEPAFEKLFGPQ